MPAQVIVKENLQTAGALFLTPPPFALLNAAQRSKYFVIIEA